ncbi:MAG: hypothetical protein FJ303_21265 [Planctomycetes bacterium]|nr:hypothetical protein [Planctomycetota bacterium]
MRIRVIDLDGSITAQSRVLRQFQPDVFDLRNWGPRIRLGCRWKNFFRFERKLDRLFGRDEPSDAWISLLGSGDFHHASLALLRRINRPFNLLVLDKHPDWTTWVPILHCGTWLYHAAQLPNVRRIFHLGGDSDFDNLSRWFAPTSLLQDGKIVTVPARRTFAGGFWDSLPHQPLRRNVDATVDHDRLEDLLYPYLEDLDRFPLYISLDKGVMWMPESIANWDSGFLDLAEIQEILQFFMKAAGNDLVGMDIVGDYSPVVTEGVLRNLLHRFEHPPRNIEPDQARLCNERTNTMLLRFLTQDQLATDFTFSARVRSM